MAHPEKKPFAHLGPRRCSEVLPGYRVAKFMFEQKLPQVIGWKFLLVIVQAEIKGTRHPRPKKHLWSSRLFRASFQYQIFGRFWMSRATRRLVGNAYGEEMAGRFQK